MDTSLGTVLLSEILGTAALTLLGCGVVANVLLRETKGRGADWLLISFGWAMAVFVGDRPASAWFHRGAAAVVFDFEVADGQVRAITFRAEPAVLEQVVRREGPEVR